MIKFCCTNFEIKKHGSRVDFCALRNGDVIISYYPKTREYLSSHSKDSGCEINYCQWCGKKMPKPLVDEWFDTLEKEYGITDPTDTEEQDVPNEFKTDEWWKKRDL